MKLIAHRGWAMGPGENTLAAFARAADNPLVDGVEFDIRKGRDGSLVVSHDPPGMDETPVTLDKALEILKPANLDLLIELKEKHIAGAVVQALQTFGLEDRSIVFGFPPAAETLPWDQPRPVRLGIIVHLPWQAQGLIDRYKPDVILLGWDKRRWTRLAFRAWWSLFSLGRLGARNAAPVAVGIIRRAGDYRWLKKQGADFVVADLDTDTMAELTGSACYSK